MIARAAAAANDGAAGIGAAGGQAVCAALADPVRLRLFGTICRDADGVRAVDLRLDAGGQKALGKLVAAGLVQRAGGRYLVSPETFRQVLRAQHVPGPAGAAGIAGVPPGVAGLFRRGKLISMPRAGKLRTELLRSLAGRFEAGRTYPEAEVRRELEAVHPDHAALRRYLVDEGLLERDNHGSYWRPAQASG